MAPCSNSGVRSCAALEKAGFKILVSTPSRSEARPICEQKRDLILWVRKLVRGPEAIKLMPSWVEQSLDLPQKRGQAWADAEKAKIADLNWRIVAENIVAQLKLAEEQLRPFQGACVQSVQAINLP
jgi:hypothetical protein